VTAPGPLIRRAETSGFLGFAAKAAAPIQALGPVKRPVRWYEIQRLFLAGAAAPNRLAAKN
jgi:hypothetical protein